MTPCRLTNSMIGHRFKNPAMRLGMGYTTDYWKRNREKILKERRERYENDPAYRDKALQRARERRERIKADKKKSKAKPTVTLPNGKTVPGYTATEVAEQIGISPDKPKYYLRQKYTPAALVSRPKRLYTKRQIGLMQQLETFLATNRAALRTPTTGEGAKAHEDLAILTKTIHKQWET